MSARQSAPERSVVVLTGTTGSGKSTAADAFRALGATVVSADELARAAASPGGPALAEIASAFGAEMLLPNGELDRKRLGELVFGAPELRLKLEAILHPRIRELSHEAFTRALESGASLVVYDCPLYFESKLDQLGFRCSIVVIADEARCIERIMKRDGIDESQARARLATQMPAAEKARRGTYVLENNGSKEALVEAVGQLFRRLVRAI